MIQGKFYQRLHFYTDSCAISPTASLLNFRNNDNVHSSTTAFFPLLQKANLNMMIQNFHSCFSEIALLIRLFRLFRLDVSRNVWMQFLVQNVMPKF